VSRRPLILFLAGLALVLLALVLFDQLIPFGPAGRRRMSLDTSVDNLIGATVEPLDRSTARAIGAGETAEGLIVTSVGTRGPAARAGLRTGDVIEAIGGTKVRSPEEAANALDEQQVYVTMTVKRDGHYATVRVPVSPAAGAAGDS
jgi:S1-C subfamily serine protease